MKSHSILSVDRLSDITSAITGPRRTTLFSKAARPAAPCASHCYAAIIAFEKRNANFRAPHVVESRIDYTILIFHHYLGAKMTRPIDVAQVELENDTIEMELAFSDGSKSKFRTEYLAFVEEMWRRQKNDIFDEYCHIRYLSLIHI